MTAVTALEALSGLCEPFTDDELPELDRADANPKTPTRQTWHRDGVVILPGFLPDDLLDAYADAWLAEHGRPITIAEEAKPLGYVVDTTDAGGWPDATPYMRCEPLRRLCTNRDLATVLQSLIGEPMAVHLNLTGWVSTQRDWHQDGYLNPDPVADWYAAVWIALDDVDPGAGPFEYIPGTHRLPTIRQARMWEAMGEPPNGFDSDWPKRSEAILTPLFEQLITEEGYQPTRFLARRGDVLIWHARLLHRGSPPADPELERRALIAHYSGIHHRPDFEVDAVQAPNGGFYFPLRTNVQV